ncbi:MAG: 16S rRNA (cytosine(967)-C(5))-methyltransferase RsmB [Lachnospiraceae bacterium]
MTNIREIILDILLAILRDGAYSQNAIHAALEKHQYLTKRDRAFITRVAEGTVERLIELDYIIDSYSQVPVANMKPVIANILRSAVYQIRFMRSVPDASAVNEAVKLAQSRGFYNLKGFVNGVLRSVSRHPEASPYPDREKDLAAFLTIAYSTPRWIVEEWLSVYGDFVTEKMLAALMEPRPTTIRLKTDGVSKSEILESLRSQGVYVKPAGYLPYACNVADYSFLPSLEAFRKGWIYPQDLGSMLVAEIANPVKGNVVFDLCAAPGGKSLHAADKMKGTGVVEARDLTSEKVALIEENVARTGLANVHPRVMDALIYDAGSESRADIVICDLPCSGLGVIGRKPDIKYRVTPERVAELADLQRKILHNAASYVKPGGVLIYSTCTVSSPENQKNVRWFLDNYSFRLESLDPYLPKELQSLSTKEGVLQLLPGIHPTDGFFIARFRREKA